MVKLSRGERFHDARTTYNQHGDQTMDAVSAATGVSKSMIQALEDDDNQRSVGYDKIAKLAAHYHVSTDFLLGLSDDPNILPRAVDDLGLSIEAVEWIKSLSPADGGDDHISVFNHLLYDPNFRLFFYSICEVCFAATAGKIYNKLHDHFFSKTPSVNNYRTAEEATAFHRQLASWLRVDPGEAHPVFPDHIRDFLLASAQYWESFETLPYLGAILEDVRGFNVKDFAEFRTNREFRYMIDAITHDFPEVYISKFSIPGDFPQWSDKHGND